MERGRVNELHYMTPIANLASIVHYGLLSHHRAAEVPHDSIADPSVQGNRVGKRVPNGRLLHDYVNLYFDARNAMMYRRRNVRSTIAVLRVSSAVLDMPGVVLSDGNAASGATQFLPCPAGLAALNQERVYTDDWDHSDPWIKQEQKRQRCAEVLVPDRVGPEHFIGCYVCTNQVVANCATVAAELAVEVNAHVFFQ
ncbi:hypothetical protein CQY20_22015 [Mycolicibacterium agri]|uniref:DarT domain-containing protein n=1 Tax=Mycolicibacterium agri TaxID=36811 RepID=A0A2A7MU59_MYCAG|nr:DUF4433 domain-containing protein [Mycolicibacterium agri]PEG35352.1 hypothetical protein CQY20_22015 [Mycolicibacterium agri]GFG53483.1 hypothetical protein MAGR_49240 [Mycolicibacterium agri]